MRYVDNRLVFILPCKLRDPAYIRFLSLLFYRSPIELENCGNKIILGGEYNIKDRTCLYVPPPNSYQYRSSLTAGTQNRALSGYRARLHLLYRYTFPKNKANSLAHCLMQGYIQKGFPKTELCKIPKQVALKVRAGKSGTQS